MPARGGRTRRPGPSTSTIRKRKRKPGRKQCERGSDCPYKDEHQHAEEFAHDLPAKKPSHSWGSGVTLASASQVRSQVGTSVVQRPAAGARGNSFSANGTIQSGSRSTGKRKVPSKKQLELIRKSRISLLEKDRSSSSSTANHAVSNSRSEPSNGELPGPTSSVRLLSHSSRGNIGNIPTTTTRIRQQSTTSSSREVTSRGTFNVLPGHSLSVAEVTSRRQENNTQHPTVRTSRYLDVTDESVYKEQTKNNGNEANDHPEIIEILD